MAFGGAVGTGLFLGIGTALSRGGPLSVFISYSVTGFAIYAMVSPQNETVSCCSIQLTISSDAVFRGDGYLAPCSWSNSYILQSLCG